MAFGTHAQGRPWPPAACYGVPFHGRVADPVAQPGSIDSAAVTGPFDSPPSEIRAIRRGAYYEFIGAFINDGNSSWTGIDLDRHEVIVVYRRTWDRRASMSRNFEFPDNRQPDRDSMVRVWTAEDGGRKEMEIVRRSRLDFDEEGAFVCAANIEWNAKREGYSRTTDTLSRSLNLIDTSGDGVPITRAIDERGITNFVMNAIVDRRRAYWKN